MLSDDLTTTIIDRLCVETRSPLSRLTAIFHTTCGVLSPLESESRATAEERPSASRIARVAPLRPGAPKQEIPLPLRERVG